MDRVRKMSFVILNDTLEHIFFSLDRDVSSTPDAMVIPP
jgi:hypothetical protein